MSSKTAAKSNPQKPEQKKIPSDSPQAKVTQDAHKEAQANRRLATQQAAVKRERQEAMRNLGVIIALFVVVGGGALAFYLRDAFRPPPPGQEVPLMQSYHLKTGDEPHPTYTTDPPTSGPHIGQLADWGVHSEPITKELQIHSLEDAGVVINYQPDLDQVTVAKLAAVTKSYSDAINRETLDNHVLMTPYPGLSNPIVLTAWRHIDRLDKFDEDRIRRFIVAYKNIDHHIESGDRPANAP